MDDFSVEALSRIKSNLAGLPSFCRLVIYDLLEYCDYQSGTISLDALDNVAHQDFYIHPMPGRKKENINGDTLRNAFRTIKKSKPDHFKFTTINQRVVIEMPFIRELYEEFYGIEEVAAVLAEDVVTAETQPAPNESPYLPGQLVGDVAADLAAATLLNFPVKKNNILYIKNKHPSQATIALALAEGLTGVTDEEQINQFIRYNQANGSLWADYNPVFINWLRRDVERTKAAQQTKKSKGQFTRNAHEYRTDEGRVKKPTIEDVYYANRDAIAPDGSRYSPGTECEPALERTYCLGVDAAIPDLWGIVPEQKWSEG